MQLSSNRRDRGFVRATLIVMLALATLGWMGCSSDSPSGPTGPLAPGPGSATGAQVSGQVTTGNAAGMTVSIEGTGLATTTDAQGSFAFEGVPAGDRVLLFATPQGDAALALPGVRPNERIEIHVALADGSASLESIEREVVDDGGEGDDGSDDGSEGAVDVFLQVAPGDWNTNWPRSSGTVQVFIRGPDFPRVQLDTIELQGDDPEAGPVLPVSTRRAGNHVLARFAKADAFLSLLDPQSGETREILIRFTADPAEEGGEPEVVERTVPVNIVGPDDGSDDGDDGSDEGELTLQVSPDAWNTNWPGSNGTVTAFLRGGEFRDVDLDSIELLGDDPEAAPLAPVDASRQGNNVRARFRQADAFALLDEPKSGDVRTVVVSFTVNAEPRELSHQVRIVGP